MKKKILLWLLLIIFFPFIFIVSPVSVFAEEEGEILDNIVSALNKETETIYEPYYNFISKLESGEYTIESALDDFRLNLASWREAFGKSIAVYKKYTSSRNPNISEISNLALSGTEKGIKAIDNYKKALVAETDEDWEYYFDRGDEFMLQAVTLHDQAVDLYNDYTGISSDIALRDWLVVGSILSMIFSLFLFIKSRRRSKYQAEIVRAGVYKELFISSLWMMGGLVVTTAGLSYALEHGGTYYIFYGPIGVGGWQLLKGLSHYFQEGRKKLDQLAKSERGAIVKKSYKKQEEKEVRSRISQKRCPYCGALLSSRVVICSKCGENIL